jgi:riboflavin kinase/FMN adenylyltransferase
MQPGAPRVTVLTWDDLVIRKTPLDRPVRMTIGAFDGLHIGHRKLMESVVEEEGAGIPLVVTFRQSPAAVLSPGTFPGLIMTWRQKLARLESLGIHTVLVIDFSEEMSNLSGKAFIGLLKENLTIEKIVVGYNFRFGKGRNAGTDVLKEMLSGTGTDVQVTEPVFWGERIVSSSRIRTTIQEGDLSEAKAMLAAAYGLDLRGVPASTDGSGRLRFSKSDLKQVVPRQGVYAVDCGGAAARPGELTVGEDSLALAVPDGREIEAVYFE